LTGITISAILSLIVFSQGEGMINSGLMTIEDLADYLKVTRRTIYDWLKHDKIPALKLVGQWRFKKDKIDAWLEEHTKHN
jgi:excisionase family DNA binding protein